MSAAQWLAGSLAGQNWFGLRGSEVSARVQGVYSPVGAGRRISMGTPEIYFAKNIDNSRLVKVTDHQRTREMAMFSASVACLFLLVMIYAFQHFSSIEYGYKTEAQMKQRDELIEANRSLRLEEAALRDPQRIDVLARRMGLDSPQAGQLQNLESNSESTGPVMARISDVAVVTMAR
jgi:cell division protein FtsL